MRYRSRPETVEAFEFTPDAEVTGPDWFARLVDDGKVIIDRALVDGATKVIGCTIYEKSARITVKDGDFIVLRRDGNITVEKQRAFREHFDEEKR